MKCITAYLPWELEQVKIEIFSDLHIGSKKCNYEEIINRIEKVKADDNTYCVILGDIINNSTKNSCGDVYEEPLTPMQQVKKACTMFEPIKDRILCITSGNHERRSYKTDGVDLCYFFASELGIADKYDYCACLLFLRVGTGNKRGKLEKNKRQNSYSIYMTHGDGNGGRLIGGKANGLQRRGQIVDADIIITGHTHSPITFRENYYHADFFNNTIQLKEQVFVNASATLNYEEYAELYGMKPSSLVSPVIILSGTNKNISIKI